MQNDKHARYWAHCRMITAQGDGGLRAYERLKLDYQSMVGPVESDQFARDMRELARLCNA